MKRIYIFLAGRGKKGIKVLAVLQGPDHPMTRITDATKLGLPQDLERKIVQQIYADRMLWEPWVASAPDYLGLKALLRDKGYTDVPMNYNAMFDVNLKSIVKQDHLEPTIKPIEKPIPTMLRKFSI